MFIEEDEDEMAELIPINMGKVILGYGSVLREGVKNII